MTFASLLALSLLISSLGPSAPLFAAGLQKGPGSKAAPRALGAVSLRTGLNARPALDMRRLDSADSLFQGRMVSRQALSQADSPKALLAADPFQAEAQAASPSLISAEGLSPEGSREEAPQNQGKGPRTLAGRVQNALAAEAWGKVFDGAKVPGGALGILPLPRPTLPEGIELDPPPSAPDPKKVPSVTINAFDLPGSIAQGDIFGTGPRVLQADPSDPAAMEKALRRMVDQEAATYGVPSAELVTMHVQLVRGRAHQADTVYAYFKQVKEGKNQDGTPYRVAIHGSYLSFTVKVVKGKPVLMAAMARLYPSVSVGTTPGLTEEEMKAKAQERLGIPPNSGLELSYLDRKVVYVQGAWHTANLYTIEGLPVMIAVDVATGEVFAWDPRVGLLEESRKAPPNAVSGRVEGRSEMTDKRPEGRPELVEVPLPHLTITLQDGRNVTTDRDGRFASDSQEGKPVAITAALSGKYALVNDRDGKPLRISVTLKPGQETQVVFNPEGAEETVVSQVNAYVSFNRELDWVRERGIESPSLDRQVPLNVNINDECNAYYTPGRPSLNFFKSSENCSETSRPGVIFHEGGHYLDDMIGGALTAALRAAENLLAGAARKIQTYGLSGGIINGGLSEGWGDIFSMYILASPLIGEGFLKKPLPDGRTWIRDGTNTYQYDANDEEHDQGQAWMGFAWKLREALLASLGAAGAALAEVLVVPTLYSKAADIPSAMAQVLLNDMDKEGNLPHEKEIRDAAKAHGVTLPKKPGAILGLLRAAASAVARLLRELGA